MGCTRLQPLAVACLLWKDASALTRYMIIIMRLQLLAAAHFDYQLVASLVGDCFLFVFMCVLVYYLCVYFCVHILCLFVF